MNCTYEITKVKHELPDPEFSCNTKEAILVRIVTEHFETTLNKLKKPCRKVEVMIPKQILQTLLYVCCPSYSVESIAGIWGQHWTTVLHSVDVVKEKFEDKHFYDPIKYHYNQIINKLPFEVPKIEKRSEKYLYGYKKIVI